MQKSHILSGALSRQIKAKEANPISVQRHRKLSIVGMLRTVATSVIILTLSQAVVKYNLSLLHSSCTGAISSEFVFT